MALHEHSQKKSGYQELKSISEKILDNKHIYHSFAHCGLEQLARRRNGFKPDDLISALITADAFTVISGEIGGLLYENLELRRMTATHSARLAKEQQLRTGVVDESIDSWTGALPTPPIWSDPN